MLRTEAKISLLYKSPELDSVLSQMNPVRTSYFITINLILFSHTRLDLTSDLLSLGFLTQVL
jgi:hypothetical protein